MLSYKEIRERYLRYLYEELDPLLKFDNTESNAPLRVLEVGCGNCINLVNLKKKYDSKVELFGIDISGKRIKVAKEYFREALKAVKLHESSITESLKWSDGFFEVVFSMHALEQIPYKTEQALSEMFRLSKKKVIMIEPVFELGNPLQRLKLIHSDHTRILLKSINNLGYEISRFEALNIQQIPNQSSIIVINKGVFEKSSSTPPLPISR